MQHHANSLTPAKAAGRVARLVRASPAQLSPKWAQVAELVDALVSGISGAIRGGSSPLLGTSWNNKNVPRRLQIPEKSLKKPV